MEASTVLPRKRPRQASRRGFPWSRTLLTLGLVALIASTVALQARKSQSKLGTEWRDDEPDGRDKRTRCCDKDMQILAQKTAETAMYVGAFVVIWKSMKAMLFPKTEDLGPGGGAGPGGAMAEGMRPPPLTGVDISLPVSSLPQSFGDLSWPLVDNRVGGVTISVSEFTNTTAFYKALGMEVVSAPTCNKSMSESVVLSFPPPHSTSFTLTLNKGSGPFGGPFKHLTFTSHNVGRLYSRAIAVKGATSLKAPQGVIEGGTRIAMVMDPSGNRVMILQKNRPYKNSICRVMLVIHNLEQSIRFYRDSLGMNVFRTHNSPRRRQKLAWVGYGSNETEGTSLELVYHPGGSTSKGPGGEDLTIMTPNLGAVLVKLRQKGHIAKIGIKDRNGPYTAMLSDPDGFQLILVDSEWYKREEEKIAEGSQNDPNLANTKPNQPGDLKSSNDAEKSTDNEDSPRKTSE
ncbi:hypothetical protein AAMO2058_000433800 [Amorphochlora amoebiformis]